MCVYYIFKLERDVFAPKVGCMIYLRNVQVENGWQKDCSSFLVCLYQNSSLCTHILASVPFSEALFVSLTFLVWIRLKYKIHL
ncbi:hypothetical protein H8958_010435 [Nasalis larvatus]|uniref:Uncharacterized protein n=3 Tax=Cercopithecinae TaxID=9528 RepID=F7D9D6_MACMU|nr:hypothetical protein EGK_00740 [Macaca mulatta]EHH49897.1 hypothetical protein EGM_00631 [Macaca fascicularis]